MQPMFMHLFGLLLYDDLGVTIVFVYLVPAALIIINDRLFVSQGLTYNFNFLAQLHMFMHLVDDLVPATNVYLVSGLRSIR